MRKMFFDIIYPDFTINKCVSNTLDYPSSAVNNISPPILLIYIVLNCCIVKRLFCAKMV